MSELESAGPPMADDERSPDVVDELKRDRDGSFATVVERYQARIYRFAARMCRNAEDARDVLQETFLAAFRGAEGFRGEAKMSTWLFRIASNACLKMRRRGKFEPVRQLSLEELGAEGPRVPDWSESPEARFLREELGEVIEGGIAELPEPYRVVLLLRDVEGFSAEETGGILGLSVPAVKSRLHRARLLLRQRLSEHLGRR